MHSSRTFGALFDSRVKHYPHLHRLLALADKHWNRRFISEIEFKALSLGLTGGANSSCTGCSYGKKQVNKLIELTEFSEVEVKKFLQLVDNSNRNVFPHFAVKPNAAKQGQVLHSRFAWSRKALVRILTCPGSFEIPMALIAAKAVANPLGNHEKFSESAFHEYYENEHLAVAFVMEQCEILFEFDSGSFLKFATLFYTFIGLSDPSWSAQVALKWKEKLSAAGHTLEM
jgi:hypothetical protein